jgi:hypothetical protein
LISSARLEGSSFDYRYVNVIGWVRKLDSDLEDTWKRSAPTRTTLGSFNPPGRGVYLQPRAHQRGFHFSPIPQARRSLVWGRVRASGYDQVLLRAYISYPNPIESPGIVVLLLLYLSESSRHHYFLPLEFSGEGVWYRMSNDNAWWKTAVKE